MGFAYLFSLLNMWITTGIRDGKKGLSVKDIVFAYHGDRTKNLLEVKLDTTMNPYLMIKKDRELIREWIANGRPREWMSNGRKRKYNEPENIQDIMDQYCVPCHNPNSTNSDLTSYEKVYESAKPDKGKPLSALAQLSHTHGFGMSVFFLFMAVIFSFSSFPLKYRIISCSLPFIAIVMDVSSMWLTKFVSPIFAYTVLLGGILIGISFAILFFGSLYDMWIRASGSFHKFV